MSKKWIKKEDWLGGEYWEDEEGHRKYVKEDWLGGKYEEDEEGRRTYIKEDWLGRTYKEDEEGRREYLKEDWLGGKYWEDEEGKRTYEKKDWLGRDVREEDGRCFITTACIQAKGLTDDCLELNTFRAFRDGYIKTLPNGDQIIREYYEIAPRIVAAINRIKNSKKVYIDLYERLVLKTLELIQRGENEEAFKNCLEIVNELKQRYL